MYVIVEVLSFPCINHTPRLNCDVKQMHCIFSICFLLAFKSRSKVSILFIFIYHVHGHGFMWTCICCNTDRQQLEVTPLLMICIHILKFSGGTVWYVACTTTIRILCMINSIISASFTDSDKAIALQTHCPITRSQIPLDLSSMGCSHYQKGQRCP